MKSFMMPAAMRTSQVYDIMPVIPYKGSFINSGTFPAPYSRQTVVALPRIILDELWLLARLPPFGEPPAAGKLLPGPVLQRLPSESDARRCCTTGI